MTRRSGRDATVPLSDYDGAWKDGWRLHFRSMLTTYFPVMAAEVDWQHEPQWLDKELQPILRRAGRSRAVDMLARVQRVSGQEQWILLHLEVQSNRELGFAARVARYNNGLYWSYGKPVVSLVILADLNDGWKPAEHVIAVADFENRLRFPVCKLIEHVETDWRDVHSLPVEVARAQIAALRTVRDPEGRYQFKWQLVRNLYNRGYNADDVREIFRLIDWMMQLPEALSERFEQQLGALEEEMDMPYVTSVERIAEARGRAEGEARGEARGAVRVLQQIMSRTLGPLPADLERRLRQLSADHLESLAAAALEFNALSDLKRWLDEHGNH